MKKKNLKSVINFWAAKALLTILGTSLLISCDDDNVNANQENTFVKLSAVYDAQGTQRNVNDIVINSFILNVEEIELEVDDDDATEGPKVSDIELEGPFVVDLIEDSSGIEQTLAEVNLPEGNYDEIEFSINESEDSESEIFEKSIFISGTINGTPFEFWHNEDLEFEIEFENGMLTLEEATATLINLQFDLNNLLTLIDLSIATDGNENGVIEINPSSEDGNSDLAYSIIDAFDEVIDAFEDSFDEEDEDDDDDENEED